MNCPYCNSTCFSHDTARLIVTGSHCKQCLGQPRFLDWNDYNSPGIPIYLSTENFLMVSFSFPYQETWYDIYYTPYNNKMFISNLDYTFISPEIVTPTNIVHYLKKLLSMKAFL